MKSFVVSTLAIVVLSAAAAMGTWWVVGAPDRSVPCDLSELEEHEVCLATVRTWEPTEILWVDARPRAAWEKNGVEGSILMNELEDWNDLEEGFMMKALMGSGLKVVVYCDQEGCGSSKYVANRLRERHGKELALEVYVLKGGFKAVRAW